jgi:hypothetical protein
MARRKKKKRGRQGLVSWVTSAIGLLIGFSNVIARGVEYISQGDWQGFGNALVGDMTGYDLASGAFDMSRLGRGWGPIVGGIVFKKGTSELVKRCRMDSALPSF